MSWKYGTPNCPACGELVHAEVDWVPGAALVFADQSGVMHYEGTTVMHWDGQENENQLRECFIKEAADSEPNDCSEVLVACKCGEEWLTEKTEVRDAECSG